MTFRKQKKGRKNRGGDKRPLIFAAFFLLLGTVCVAMWWRETFFFHRAESLYQASIQNSTVAAEAESPPQPAGITVEPSIDFLSLRSEFPDIVGWIKCEGTPLDYPVVQGRDNEYYLDHLADRSKNPVGAIFLDERAEPDFSSTVSVIYGHHIKDEKMFGSLNGFRDQLYYEEHPIIRLDSPEGNYEIELFAAYLEDGAKGSYPFSFANKEEWDQYIGRIRDISFIKGTVEPEWGDPIVILSTCTYDFPDARLAVVGRFQTVENSAGGELIK